MKCIRINTNFSISFKSKGRKDNSDSSDNEPASSSRYGASSRRLTRNSSDSDDSDKYDRRKLASLKLRDTGRPMTSSRKPDSMPDIDSYEGANVKNTKS